MPRELRLVVDRDREEPASPPRPADPIALALGITILGLALVGIGMIAWVNSEAFSRAVLDQTKP